MRIDGERPTIAIFRALQLGDMLNSVPALRAIRTEWPRAHVALIGLPWAREFVARFDGYLDEHIEFPGFPGIDERPPDLARFPHFLDAMVRRRWDLSIQMHGDGRVSNYVVALLGARRSIGFYRPDAWQPTPDYMPYPDTLPEAQRHLLALSALGIDSDDTRLEFPVHVEDREALTVAVPELTGDPIACLHPGARDPRRRWPADRFAAVGEELAQRGFQVVLTGTADEGDVLDAVEARMEIPVANLGGRLGLGAFAALLQHASVVVSNDTGAAHLAVATGTPSVTVFLASDTRRWGPSESLRSRHRVVGDQPNDEPRDVPVESVLSAVDALHLEVGSRAA